MEGEDSGQTFLMLKGVPKELKKDLRNISKNIGISMAALVKPKLRELVDAYPQQMKVRRES